MIDFTEEKIKKFREYFDFIAVKGVQCDEITLHNIESFLSLAISEAREEEKQKHLANLRVMLALGDEIVEEAMPNYEDNDNEVYTIVDWQINARKLRKLYPKELSQKQLKK